MIKIYKDKETGKYFTYIENTLIDLDESTVEYMNAMIKDLIEIEESNIYKTVGTEVEKIQEINEKIEELKKQVFSYYNLLSDKSKNRVKESIKSILDSLESYEKVMQNIEEPKKEKEVESIWTRIKKKFTSMKNRLLRKS